MRQKWKTCLLYTVAGIAVLASVTGCGMTGKTGQESRVIAIGSNLERTGYNASFGTSTENAIQMAVDEINAKDGLLGKQVQLVSLDNRSDVAGAADAIIKLADAKVVGIIGPDTSSNVIAIAPMVAQHRIPLISPKATHPAVTVDPATGKVRDYVFRSTFIDFYQGKIAAEFASRRLHAKRAAILVDNSSDYAIGLARFFADSFRSAGGTIVGQEAYLQKDVDFKSTLTKLKALQPDILFVPGYYQEVGLIIRQARELQMTLPIMGGDGWDSDKLTAIAGAANLNGTYYTNHYSPDDTNVALQEFIKRFELRFGYRPDSYAVYGYDAVRLLFYAIERANSTDPEKIQKELTQVKNYKGISGMISIDAEHNTLSSGVVIELVNGERKFLERIDLD